MVPVICFILAAFGVAFSIAAALTGELSPKLWRRDERRLIRSALAVAMAASFVTSPVMSTRSSAEKLADSERTASARFRVSLADEPNTGSSGNRRAVTAAPIRSCASPVVRHPAQHCSR